MTAGETLLLLGVAAAAAFLLGLAIGALHLVADRRRPRAPGFTILKGSDHD